MTEIVSSTGSKVCWGTEHEVILSATVLLSAFQNNTLCGLGWKERVRQMPFYFPFSLTLPAC